MSDTPTLPVVPTPRLPVAQLRAPFSPTTVHPHPAAQESPTDLRNLCDALEPFISAAIARKTRQRRYTP